MGVYSFAITTDLSSPRLSFGHFSLRPVRGTLAMYRSLTLPFASFLLFQAAVSEWFFCDAVRPLFNNRRFFTLTVSSVSLVLQATLTTSCDTTSLPTRSLEGPSSSPSRYFDDAVRQQQSAVTTTNTPQDLHHHPVGVIVGACLGAAGAVLLIGLVLFWLLVRHRHTTASAEAQEVVPPRVPRKRAPCHGVVIVANHPSRSIDLVGADSDTMSVAPASDETSETKWDRSTEVLDISVENAPRSPLPTLPLPESTEPSVPTLSIHTDVQAELSPPSSQTSTPAGSSRSPIRPLPTPPTKIQVRRHRSAKAEEAHREFSCRPLPHRKISADDVHAYVHCNRQSTGRSVTSMSCEAGGCQIVHHHDGGMNVWADFPPPYSESLPVQETIPSKSQAMQ